MHTPTELPPTEPPTLTETRSLQVHFSLLLPLLAVVWFLAIQALTLAGDSQTSDEGVHLAAGLSYLHTHDTRMNPEHPPLAKLVAALPLLALDVSLPLDHPAWSQGQEWTFGAAFLYRNARPPGELLFLGRLPIVACGLALLLLAAGWARRLYGGPGALLVLILLASEPTLLAHAHYVTSDVLLALCFLATLYALLHARRRSGLTPLLLAGLCLGLTLGTKFSGLLVLPFLLLLVPGEDQSAGVAARLRAGLMRAALVLLMAMFVLAVLYQGWPVVPYLKGMQSMQSGWNAFLLGEISPDGFYSYFGWSLLLKLPPGTLLCLALALFSSLRARLRGDEPVLLLAALWFIGVSSLLRINIGIRHILPALPLLLILCGRLVAVPGAALRQRLIVAGLAAWSLLEVGLALPYPLAYFSSLAGGPFAGHRYLSDSNLDWGQDMGRLAAWARKEAPDGLLAGVFFGGDPTRLGLTLQPVPSFGAVGARERPLEALPSRLLLAMSAINLQGVYFTPDGPLQAHPPPTPELYRFLLERPPLLRLTPSIWIWDLSQDPDALLRLGMLHVHFGWIRSAVGLLERYLTLRPEDSRTALGLERLKRQGAE